MAVLSIAVLSITALSITAREGPSSSKDRLGLQYRTFFSLIIDSCTIDNYPRTHLGSISAACVMALKKLVFLGEIRDREKASVTLDPTHRV